jgi:hypothetical protein
MAHRIGTREGRDRLTVLPCERRWLAIGPRQTAATAHPLAAVSELRPGPASLLEGDS